METTIMDLKTIKTTGKELLEHCWLIKGKCDGQLWWGHRCRMTVGAPETVKFDAEYAIKREQTKHDLLGFCHTHPCWPAIPSPRDYRTMRAWYNCFGKSLLCVIDGTDGLRGYWFDNDEDDPIECQVKRFGNLLVGTTEYYDDRYGCPMKEILEDVE